MNVLKIKKKVKKKQANGTGSKSLKNLLLSGPTMTLPQYQSFLRTRELFEQWKAK